MRREEGDGEGEEKRVPEETQEKRDGETEEERHSEGRAHCLRLWQREKKTEKRGREQKSDSLTAAPNGFSGEKEREGEKRRGREGIMRGL